MGKWKSAVISKGSIIGCPRCEQPYAEVLNDLSKWSKLQAVDLKGIREPIRFQMRMATDCCGAIYFFNGKIYLVDVPATDPRAGEFL